MAIVDKHVTPLLLSMTTSTDDWYAEVTDRRNGYRYLFNARYRSIYVSTAATPITDACALKAVAMIAENLPLAVEDGSNAKAREAMAYAQFLAEYGVQ